MSGFLNRTVASLQLCLGSIAMCAQLAAAASSPTDEQRETVEAIVADASRACKNVKTATYSVTYSIKRLNEEDFSDPYTAKVWMAGAEANDELGMRFRIEFPPGDFGSQTYSYDGSELRIIRPERAAVLIAPAGEDAKQYFRGQTARDMLEMPFFGKQRRLEWILERASNVEYQGVESIDGVSCDVISLSYPDPDEDGTIRWTWWIGEEDHLPRAWSNEMPGFGMIQKQRFKARNLAIDNVIEKNLFRAEIPEEFEIERYSYAEDLKEAEAYVAPQEEMLGQPLPSWSLTNAEGEEITSESLRGRYVVMDFWGTWCGPCLIAIPKVEEIHQRLGSRSVVVLGISAREPEGANPAKILRSRGGTYTLLENGDDLASTLKIEVYPTLLLVGPDGKLIEYHIGVHPQKGYIDLIESLESKLDD